MYVNGHRVFGSGTLVLAAGEAGTIDFPLGPLNLAFVSHPGVEPCLRQDGGTLTFINFDGGTELSGTFNFAGAAGSAIEARTIYLAYAVRNIVTPAGLNWVIHFTITLT
jgi:hypothetical protein